MKTDYYILDEKGDPIPVDDGAVWGHWMENNPAPRTVAKTVIGDAEVSTVFLGLDHSFGGDNATPILYETMIFGGEHDAYQARYATREEAIRGHWEACTLVDPFTAWVREVRAKSDADHQGDTDRP